MSTPLNDLPQQPSDPELTQRILQNLNSPNDFQQPSYPQQQQQQPSYQEFRESPRILTEPPVSLSTGQYRMDVGPTQANVIGGARPTMEDFRSMMNPTPPGMTQFQPHRAPGVDELYVPSKSQQPPQDLKSTLALALRGPTVVAIIVFILNLPVVTGMLSRYAAWMYLNNGEISVGGLLVKALLGAAMYGLYQTGVSLLEPIHKEPTLSF
jgi:hypothetical protein